MFRLRTSLMKNRRRHCAERMPLFSIFSFAFRFRQHGGRRGNESARLSISGIKEHNTTRAEPLTNEFCRGELRAYANKTKHYPIELAGNIGSEPQYVFRVSPSCNQKQVTSIPSELQNALESAKNLFGNKISNTPRGAEERSAPLSEGRTTGTNSRYRTGRI